MNRAADQAVMFERNSIVLGYGCEDPYLSDACYHPGSAGPAQVLILLVRYTIVLPSLTSELSPRSHHVRDASGHVAASSVP
jgi:hypothetical protein